MSAPDETFSKNKELVAASAVAVAIVIGVIRGPIGACLPESATGTMAAKIRPAAIITATLQVAPPWGSQECLDCLAGQAPQGRIPGADQVCEEEYTPAVYSPFRPMEAPPQTLAQWAVLPGRDGPVARAQGTGRQQDRHTFRLRGQPLARLGSGTGHWPPRA